MNKFKINLLFILFFLFFKIVFCSEIINLPDGRTINIKNDGTYEFLNKKKTIKITFHSLGDSKWGRDKCVAEFSLENQAYGTIYSFRGWVQVF
ncbi:MAG: hypothetical protein CL661_02935 [Bacteroidetes bacterium]|nr:hypothetical protein [Bacteroidota bacterium]